MPSDNLLVDGSVPSDNSGFKIPDVPKPSTGADEVADWAAEVRPSMRKLRQGMDSLLKTSRLMCSVLRLQQVMVMIMAMAMMVIMVRRRSRRTMKMIVS